jgi:hypothetical protein
VARAWAATLAAPEPTRRWSAARAAGLAGSLALTAAVGALFGDIGHDFLLPGGSDWHERRLARRILAATRQPCGR